MNANEIYLFIINNIGYNYKAREWLISHYINAAKKHGNYHMGVLNGK